MRTGRRKRSKDEREERTMKGEEKERERMKERETERGRIIGKIEEKDE